MGSEEKKVRMAREAFRLGRGCGHGLHSRTMHSLRMLRGACAVPTPPRMAEETGMRRGARDGAQSLSLFQSFHFKVPGEGSKELKPIKGVLQLASIAESSAHSVPCLLYSHFDLRSRQSGTPPRALVDPSCPARRPVRG
jgi:hypothetical protein